MCNESNRRFRHSLFLAMFLVGTFALGCGGAGGGNSTSGSGGQSDQGGGGEITAQQEADHYMSQAGFAMSEDDYGTALANYLAAAEVYDRVGGDTIDRAEAHFLAAGLTYRNGDLQSAIDQYQIAVDIYMKFSGNSKIKAAVGLNNMGSIYKEMQLKDKARNCWHNAMQIYKAAPPELQNRSNMAVIEQNLSDLQEGF